MYSFMGSCIFNLKCKTKDFFLLTDRKNSNGLYTSNFIINLDSGKSASSLSNSEAKICSKCGKRQEEESIFCGSCGADLSSKTEGRSIDNRTLTHRPLENEEFSRKNTSASKIGRFTPGSEKSGKFDRSTFTEATYTPVREYVTKALILAIIGFFFNLLFIPTYFGFKLVIKAEEENEDRIMILVTKTLLWVQLIGWTIAILGILPWILSILI